MGWSNHDIGYGGDIGLLPDPWVFDHHGDTIYYNLNGGCAGHLLYSYSAIFGDGDAGYRSFSGFGGVQA